MLSALSWCLSGRSFSGPRRAHAARRPLVAQRCPSRGKCGGSGPPHDHGVPSVQGGLQIVHDTLLVGPPAGTAVLAWGEAQHDPEGQCFAHHTLPSPRNQSRARTHQQPPGRPGSCSVLRARVVLPRAGGVRGLSKCFRIFVRARTIRGDQPGEVVQAPLDPRSRHHRWSGNSPPRRKCTRIRRRRLCLTDQVCLI